MNEGDLGLRYNAALVWAVDSRRNPHGMPYLSAGLLGLNPVWVNDFGTAAVDRGWRVYLDPCFVADLDVAELAALLVHEVSHLLRDHADRSERIGVTPLTAAWANVCQDAEINGDISQLPLPGRAVLPSDVGIVPGTPWEIPYLRIASRPMTAVADCGSGASGGDRRSYESDDPAHPIVGEAQAERLRDAVASSIIEHAATANAGWLRWAHDRVPSGVDWRVLLQRTARSILGSAVGRDDRTRSRPNRRFPGWDVVLPGSRGHTCCIAVILDTSASISEDLLTTFLAEVDGLALASGATVRLIENDTVVHADRLVRRAPRSVLGGGGTDLRAGFEMLSTQQPQPDLIVVCTDGLTPWPETCPVPPVVAVLPHSGRAPAWSLQVQV